MGFGVKLLCWIFQFTPLREGRLLADINNTLITIISIHAPPRGATILTNMSNKIEKFQFTPLREGRPAESAR